MPLTPAINTRVNITAADINGNRVPKQYNFVQTLTLDYYKGMVSINDSVQGLVYFPILSVTSMTVTIVGGVGGGTSIVMF